MTCQTAWSTGAGTFRVDTSNATSSPSGNCNAKWYTFVATANGTVAASTCSFFTYDTMLTAYSACNSGYIARNDDSCGGLGSSISFPVTGGQQYWIALGGWNCQRGQSDLVLSGPIGSLDDCNGNGVSDACEVANGFVADCNGNGVPDSCDLAAGGGVDCNANGTLDSCEIASGAAEDCNGNGVPDSCDIASIPYSGTRSGTLATNGGTVYTTFAGMPVANAPVQFRFEVNADIDYSPAEFVLFTAGGSSQISIQISGAQCGTEIRTLSIPAATYNSARSSNGDLTFAIRTGSETDSFCANTWRIDVNVAGLAAPDCNLNGRIDTCELADGSAVDQNGNGVPDSCDPYPTLTLTANAAACNAIGSVIDVDARLSGVLNLVVAGQVVLDWDPSKLQLLETNPGDAPYVANYLIDSASGQALILVSSSQGGSGTTAPSAIVSRLKFQVIGGSCDGSGTSVGFGTAAGGFETQFTDGFGTSIEPTLVASAGFVADDGAPVLANVPADVSVQAFAGENGYALVTLGSPTATDGCLSGVTITGTRSDGQALTAAWPSGSTTVTWAAVDACGNASYASTMVTVDPTNTMDLSAAFGGNFAGASRSLSLTMLGGAGPQSRTQTVSIPWGGASSFSVNDLPVDAYTCATIEDPARSLKARVTVSDTGSVWTAAAATMVLGDLINDEVIDVLDWGAYVVSNPAADLNADGFINAVDGNIILANFTRRGDGVCGSSANGPRDPILAITVADVVSMGLPELAGADLNGDGWIDQADIDLGH
jgi:hypothetical protein